MATTLGCRWNVLYIIYALANGHVVHKKRPFQHEKPHAPVYTFYMYLRVHVVSQAKTELISTKNATLGSS